MKHVLLARVQDQPGVLNRVASLFRRRAFNIDSLTVGASESHGWSRMTIVVDATRTSARLVAANLGKLVAVEEVKDVTHLPTVARDLALIRVRCTPEERGPVHDMVAGFRARVADVGSDSVIVEAAGTEEDLDSLVELLRPRGVLEIVRTGRVAMVRGANATAEN
jgi:acetolactate synthase-1/3 small subunit